MNPLLALAFASVLCAAVFAAESAPGAVHLRAATPNRTTVPVYQIVEFALDLAAASANPFDPEELDVFAVFTGPNGKVVRVNGFLDQAFKRRLDGNEERLDPAGEPAWRLRFAPTLPGEWTYQVTARSPRGAWSEGLPTGRFTATPANSPGFIRIAPKNPRGFAFDNGQPYFAVGENLGWSGSRGTYDYDDWLAALGKAGANWIRIWMCSWNCALEWGKEPKGEQRRGEYFGVGRYSLGNAWKLDTLLERCQRENLYVMLCFGTYGEFNDGGYFNEGQWKANPYNAANGGPCGKPEDFWTNDQARRLYRQRLRYLTARYGAFTGIQSWEFWNEAKAPAPWVAEMARFLKGTGEFASQPADPYGHLVSTTYGNPEVWRIPEIDFTQTHHYGKGDVPDHAPVASRDALEHAPFGKPHLLAEFGIDWRAPDAKYDPDHQGVNLHNGLWSATLAGDAGTAMIWWWDNYLHPANLYAHFTPVRKFVDQVPWTAGPWEPITVDVAADVKPYALRQGRWAILWVQNPQHHWKNRFEKKPIPPTPAQEIRLHGLGAGQYVVKWWDTWKGGVTRTETVATETAILPLQLPSLETDIAALISPAP